MIGKIQTYTPVFFALSLVFFLSGKELKAQQPNFQVTANKTTVAVGERFRVDFKINASGERFDPPNFDGFRVLSGPNQSTNMQFVNGRSSYSVGFGYVLMAMAEGEYVIGPASIQVGTDVIRTDELKIEVLAVASNSNASSNANSNANPNEPKQKQKVNPPKGEDQVFLTASISNTSPYVGQQVTATYKLYYALNIVDNSFTTLPSMNGFWSEDVDVQNGQRETEMVNGKRYNVAVLKKSVLIPQRSGSLELDPLEMDLVVQQQVQSRSRNLFDQFFGNFQNVKISAKSLPLKVNVKPLPVGKPEGFGGAVGSFDMTVAADRYEVPSNEAINLEYVISGKGNIKLLEEPVINFPSDFEVYDPKVEDKVVVNGGGMSGKRTYKYLVIPRHKGNFTIDPVAFSYFDPIKARYVTLKSDALNFNISKGEEDEGGNVVSFSGVNKEEIKLLGNDIRYIKQDTILLEMGHSFFGSWLYYLLWLLPFPLFFLFLFGYKKLGEKRSDGAYMQRSRANKMAIKRLSKAQKMLKEGNSNGFYEEVFKALNGFFEDKFNIGTSEMSKEKIEEILTQKKVDDKNIRQVLELIGKCEMARFSPMSQAGNKEIYTEAVELLSRIQKGLK